MEEEWSKNEGRTEKEWRKHGGRNGEEWRKIIKEEWMKNGIRMEKIWRKKETEFLNPHSFITQCSKPLIFQIINSVRSNNVSLKYQNCIPLCYKDIRFKSLSLWQRLKSFLKRKRRRAMRIKARVE